MRHRGLIVALATLLLAAALTACGGGGDNKLKASTAQLTTQGALQKLAGDAGHPVYWAGQRGRRRLEVTVTRDGSIYVRYLPPGVAAGDPRPTFLTIGTYHRKSAYADVRSATQQAPLSVGHVGDGLSVVRPQHPTSVYIAFPGKPYLIEVYAPTRSAALAVVRSGDVRPVG